MLIYSGRENPSTTKPHTENAPCEGGVSPPGKLPPSATQPPPSAVALATEGGKKGPLAEGAGKTVRF